MRSEINLNLEGFTVYFNFEEVIQMNGFFDLVVSLNLNIKDTELQIKSLPRYISTEELGRFTIYINNHINNLRQGLYRDSDIFTPVQLGFQFQALSGEVFSENDGDFGVLLLLNVGRPNEDGGNVYMGGESVVRFENINVFVNAIQDLIKSVNH